jgi:hypothetical protein
MHLWIWFLLTEACFIRHIHPPSNFIHPSSRFHPSTTPLLPSPPPSRTKEWRRWRTDWLTSSHRKPHSWRFNIADCQQFHQHIEGGIPKPRIRRYQLGAPKSGGRNINYFRIRLDMVMILAWIALHVCSTWVLELLFWVWIWVLPCSEMEPMWGLQFCKGSSRHSHGYGDDFGARELLSAWLGPAARICGRECLIFQISCTSCVSVLCSIWMKFASRRCALMVVTHSFWVKEWVINLF